MTREVWPRRLDDFAAPTPCDRCDVLVVPAVSADSGRRLVMEAEARGQGRGWHVSRTSASGVPVVAEAPEDYPDVRYRVHTRSRCQW